MNRKLSLLLILLLFIQIALGQVNSPSTPQSGTFQPVETSKSYNPNTNTKQSNSSQNNNHQYGSALQPKKADEMIDYGTTNTPNDIYNSLNKNNYTLASDAFIPPKQIQSINYIKALINEVNNTERTGYQFPALTTNKWRFDQAFNEISKMLNGRADLDLKRAVFLTENAYLDGRLDLIGFEKQISNAADFIRRKIIQDGLNPIDNLTINYYIHKYICDTLELNFNGKKLQSLPKKYDFNDPFGIEDPSKMFVSKLLREQTGQCKSLPLLFLILTEKLGGNAYLSFSPSHSFIKCKDRNNKLFNIELTNGMLTNDAWLVGSGYIKTEAVRSGIYLDTLNKRQVIANCLVDLANYYSWRFGKPNVQMGQDEFILKCVDLALEHHETNINAILVKSDNITAWLNYLASKKGFSTEEELLNDPITSEVFRKRNMLYALADGLGYEYFGESEYKKWLNQLEQVKFKLDHENKMKEFKSGTFK